MPYSQNGLTGGAAVLAPAEAAADPSGTPYSGVENGTDRAHATGAATGRAPAPPQGEGTAPPAGNGSNPGAPAPAETEGCGAPSVVRKVEPLLGQIKTNGLPQHADLLHEEAVRADEAAAEYGRTAEEEARAHLHREEEVRREQERLSGVAEEAAAEADRAQEAFDTAAEDYRIKGRSVPCSCPAETVTVEEAKREVLAGAPTEVTLAGEQGQVPPSQGSGVPAWVEWPLALPAGFILALCFGTLIGLVSLSDIKHMRVLPLLLSAAVGFVLVVLLEQLCRSTIRSLAMSLDEKEEGLPGARAMAWCGLGAVAILAAAEVAAEAFGLRDLHAQHRAEAVRMNQEAGDPLPLGVCFVIGLLVSAPYLGVKAAREWQACLDERRRARAAHHRREWEQEQLARPEVREVLVATGSVEDARDKLQQAHTALKEARRQRDALQVPSDLAPEARRRLEAAHATATSLRDQVVAEARDLVARQEKLPPPREGVYRLATKKQEGGAGATRAAAPGRGSNSRVRGGEG